MFSIIVIETKAFLRDKTSLFFLILFPTMLVFLLGSLMESMDKAEETIGVIKIQYLVDTKDPYQTMAIQSFIESAGNNESIVFEKAEELSKAKELAGKDEITAVIVFSGDPVTIQVYEGSSQIKNRTVGALLNGFIQMKKAVSTVIAANPDTVSNINTETVQTDYLREKDLGIKRNMMDYYAVSMVTMIGFMSALGGAAAFVEERQNKTINRLIAAPMNRVSIFLQKIFGMAPQVILQTGVIMLVSVLVFHAHYAATPADNLYLFLMFFIVTLCMISLGAIVGLLVKASPMVILMPVIWLMMFFGGTFAKTISIKGITAALPNYKIQQAAFDLAIFGHYEKANQVIIICGIVMVAALAAGAFLFSKKEEER